MSNDLKQFFAFLLFIVIVIASIEFLSTKPYFQDLVSDEIPNMVEE